MMPTPANTRRRGRPPKISRDQIIDSALEIGLDRFSMDAIAEALGVTTPALYSHVAGRDEIVLRGAAQVIRLTTSSDEATDWQTWMRAWATRIRVELGAVGEGIITTMRGGVDLAAIDVAERGMNLMVEAGFTPADAGRALWIVTRLAFTADSQPSEAASIARGVTGDAVPTTMQESIDAIAEAGPDVAFDFEIDTVIAGLEARLG